MAKKKQIVKFLEYAYEEERKEFTEDGQIPLDDDFEKGVLFGINLARVLIKEKRDKDHDYF